MTLIYHITTRAAWAQAQRDGAYRTESLTQEGFIHFSGAEQVVRTANLYYAGQRELVLLVVDPARLKSELRYEQPAKSPGSTASRRDEYFPHLYGTLNLDAVAGVVDFPPDAGDTWSRLPPEASR
ncbi:MAG: DUF952 domain-containing protein [Anaerolineae bacterium]|nr:DUF952 domain-containing protein [Anaerolineae bacterium]